MRHLNTNTFGNSLFDNQNDDYSSLKHQPVGTLQARGSKFTKPEKSKQKNISKG